MSFKPMQRKGSMPWAALAIAYFIAICILSFRLVHFQSGLREARQLANKVQMDCLQQGGNGAIQQHSDTFEESVKKLERNTGELDGLVNYANNILNYLR